MVVSVDRCEPDSNFQALEITCLGPRRFWLFVWTDVSQTQVSMGRNLHCGFQGDCGCRRVPMWARIKWAEIWDYISTSKCVWQWGPMWANIIFLVVGNHVSGFDVIGVVSGDQCGLESRFQMLEITFLVPLNLARIGRHWQIKSLWHQTYNFHNLDI